MDEATARWTRGFAGAYVQETPNYTMLAAPWEYRWGPCTFLSGSVASPNAGCTP